MTHRTIQGMITGRTPSENPAIANRPKAGDSALLTFDNSMSIQGIVENYSRCVAAHGFPTTPVGNAYFGTELGRGWGKTHALIDSLPADGSAILLVRKQSHWYTWLRQRVLDQRPGYPINRLLIMTRDQIESASGKVFLYSNRLPVFVDHSVTDDLAVKFVEQIQPKA